MTWPGWKRIQFDAVCLRTDRVKTVIVYSWLITIKKADEALLRGGYIMMSEYMVMKEMKEQGQAESRFRVPGDALRSTFR